MQMQIPMFLIKIDILIVVPMELQATIMPTLNRIGMEGQFTLRFRFQYSTLLF